MPPVDQGQFASKPVVQRSGLARIGVRLEAERSLQLGGGLAMRCELSRPAGRLRCEPQHGSLVSRLLRVIGEAGVVITSKREQSIEDPGVDRAGPVRGDCLRDG